MKLAFLAMIPDGTVTLNYDERMQILSRIRALEYDIQTLREEIVTIVWRNCT